MEGSAPAATGAAHKWAGNVKPGGLAAERLAHTEELARDFVLGAGHFPGDARGRVHRRWMLIGDAMALAAAATIFALIYSATWDQNAGPPIALMIASFIVIWTGGSALLGHYHMPERRLDYTMGDDIVPLILVTTLASWGSLMAASALSTGIVPIGAWMGLWLAAIGCVLVARFLLRRMVVRRPWYCQKVLLVGTKSDLARIRRRLDRHPEFGLKVASAVYLDPPGVTDHGPNGGYPSIHLPLQAMFSADGEGVSEIVEFADVTAVNRVLIATPPRGLDERETIARALSHAGYAIDIASTEVGGISQRAELHHLEGLPIITLPTVTQGRVKRAAKRAFDFGAASAGLLVLSPLLAGIAIAIKLNSPGPVLFRQGRIGFKRREFQMAKFRTMVDGADRMKEEVADQNFHAGRDGGQMFKIVDDPRVTKVGNWLRRFSLDELPQLINVVRGDMSLVGPRPLIPGEAVLVEDDYDARFGLRPGMTGPWQAHGRSEIGFDDMVRLDDTYARNWTMSSDIELLVRTLGAVTSGKGAY